MMNIQKKMFDTELADLNNLLFTWCDCFPNDDEARNLKERVLNLYEQQTGSRNTRIENRRGAGRKPSITEEQKQAIINSRKSGMTFDAIAKKHNVSVGSVHKILNPSAYK